MEKMLKYQELDLKIGNIASDINNDVDRMNALKMQQSLKEYQAKLVELNKKSKALFDEFESLKKVFNSMAENLEVVGKNADTTDEKKLDGLIEANEAITNNLLRLQKKILVVKQSCDEVQNEYNSIMKNARLAKSSMQKYKESYTIKKEKAEKEIESLKAELEKLSKQVDPKLLAKYKQKRTEKSNVFVPQVGGKCGGCRMEISVSKLAKLKADGMIECENCGRIIYNQA